ncbi:VRR-NUC domain-containing protein [Bordetella trematum]|uniref:VRR-NUC domain-containing protein n=1 Tax=Bordetella trematum TaxID=123899 RepID=UPI003988FEFD
MKRWPAAKRGSRLLGGPSEDTIQAQVIEWADLQKSVYPELGRLFHVPNGGQRHAVVAAKLKAQGVRAGVPDLFLPVQRAGCPGLWIEMKTTKGSLRDSQKDWIAYLDAAGYRVSVCRSFDEARQVLLDYLNPKITNAPGYI